MAWALSCRDPLHASGGRLGTVGEGQPPPHCLGTGADRAASGTDGSAARHNVLLDNRPATLLRVGTKAAELVLGVLVCCAHAGVSADLGRLGGAVTHGGWPL